MNISISQIIDALKTLCVLSGDKEPIIEKLAEAQSIINDALKDLDGLTVAGRNALDALLGCMMALERLAGKSGDNNA